MKHLIFLLTFLALGAQASGQTQQGSQFQRTYAKSLDYYYGKTVSVSGVGAIGWPWASVTEANANIPITRRYYGMTVSIGPDTNDYREYCYCTGKGNNDLVPKYATPEELEERRVVSAVVTGTSTKVITITFGNGDTVQATFEDLTSAPNAPPVASSVSISGTPEEGQTLTGSYSYSDADSDPQGTSTKQWYRADNTSGLNRVAISGATGTTYVLTASDTDKYIQYGVTPIATSGTTPGTEALSAYTAVVTALPETPLLGYYLAVDDNTVPTKAFILANGTSFEITSGQDYSINFPNSTAKYWKVFEPSTEPEKTHNMTQFGPDNFGSEGTFGVGITVEDFRGYISNFPTFNTQSAVNFNQ